MAASTKGLSLGKNEDPKSRRGEAKQVSLDGINVAPVTGSTQITEPKVQNARWFGESAVQPASLTKIPQLELPSMAGVIEPATPKDAGRMGDSLVTFAQSVADYGSSTASRRKNLREENEAIANKIITTWGQNPTQPVKDLDVYIQSIKKSIAKIQAKETLTQEDLQTIRDYEKLIGQINNKRNLGEVLLSKDRERVVKNRAQGFQSYAENTTVADLNLAGGITDKNGDLKDKKISELDPNSEQWIAAFNNYVYGDMDLSGFELKNVEGIVSNSQYQAKVTQLKSYNAKEKDRIMSSSLQSIETNLELLVQKNNATTEVTFISDLQDDVEFLKSTHLFTNKEIDNFVQQSIGMMVYFIGEKGGEIDAEAIINRIFLGENIGKEDQILPLMTGKVSDRVLKDGTINKKLFLINAIGGEARLNEIISEVTNKNVKANNSKTNGLELAYDTSFNNVLESKPEGKTESYLSLLIKGDNDDITGNVHVNAVITELNSTRLELIEKANGDTKKIAAINKSYTEKLSNIKNNLLVSDFKEELKDLNDRSLKVALGEATETEIADLKTDLFMFRDTYKDLPKLDDDLSQVIDNLENYADASNKTSLKFGTDIVNDLFTTYSNSQDSNFDKDTVWNKNKAAIDARVKEIVQQAIQDHPNDIQARNEQINRVITNEWNNGGFIDGREVNTTPINNMGNPTKASKDYLNSNGFNKKGMLDANGYFTDNSIQTFTAHVRNKYQPMFSKNALYQYKKVGGQFQPNGGLMLMWMSGEDMPEGWDIIEKNLEKMDNMSVTKFFEEQLIKNGLDPKVFPLEVLKSLEGKNQQERREAWAKLTGTELKEDENITGVINKKNYEAGAFVTNNNTFYIGPYGTAGKEVQRLLNDKNMGWYNLWGAI